METLYQEGCFECDVLGQGGDLGGAERGSPLWSPGGKSSFDLFFNLIFQRGTSS
jgi:hypothetical protein